MSVKDKLQIYLITYNRKEKFQRTLDAILAEDSPIKDFDITILNNASTDGTTELIEAYCQNHKNIVHIKHKINIGGNANICRAFEMGSSCEKEYFWILCDDDYYDFSGWNFVEEEIEKKSDIICVSNYCFESPELFEDKAYQLFQLSFVPAGIYKTSLMNDSIIANMYDSILTMFQQICPVAYCMNNGGTIKVLNIPIVKNGIFIDCVTTDEVCLYRGQDSRFLLQRKKENNWVLGWSQILTLLNDKDLITRCVEISMTSKIIGFTSLTAFVNFLLQMGYFNFDKVHYVLEILSKLSPVVRIKVLVLAFKSWWLRWWTTDTGLYICLFGRIKMKILPNFDNKI